MIKFFCDRCGEEMPEGETQRLEHNKGRFSVEIMTTVDEICNGGHLCHNCIREIVADSGKDGVPK
jgi:hypothetical protein